LRELASVAFDSAYDTAIAIVGMSCRFPDAPDIETFWTNLRQGRESISFFSDEELLASGTDPKHLTDETFVRASAVLNDIEMFDAGFFGFSPREAELLDPQQRLFLECAWEAIENAGYNPDADKRTCGVFAGASASTYLLHNLHGRGDLLASTGAYQMLLANDKDYLPTRVSYKLNLKGPSVNIQTACSTSLVAVHLACQSLLSGECDIALGGGASVRVPHKAGYLYQEGMILSPDGHCRAFDAEARGTVGGNGAGVVVLKRLSDALADGDHIYAVIKGSAINNDGALKAGYAAPSVDGQAAVIAEAMAVAGVSPETISYVEAHGTATAVGDPIEIAALHKAFSTRPTKKASCLLGSVKSNFGHLDVAAGVAGLIKTALALENEFIPPSLHFQRGNPAIDFANSPFHIATRLAEWKRAKAPRRAGVSSFGIGGTNAHIVLEEAPQREVSGASRPWQLFVIAARTNTALRSASSNLENYLEQHPGVCLADVANSLSKRRTTFSHRKFIVCQTSHEAVVELNAARGNQAFTAVQEMSDRPVAFLFSGQGTQYPNMGLELYEVEPTFRQHIDYCSEILRGYLGYDLRQIIYPADGRMPNGSGSLDDTSVTQPALFVVEYALAKLWMEWGVRPHAMIGHSLGEYVAACLSGVFSLEDGLRLVAGRARLMQRVESGAMLSVSLSEREVRTFLGNTLDLAAVNTPTMCVVSGSNEAITALESRLLAADVVCARLRTSHAFHSRMMDPVLGEFQQQVGAIKLSPPQIPYVSNVTGNWITAAEATDPRYWVRHLRHTVFFATGLQCLDQDSQAALLEVGPGGTLGTLARNALSQKEDIRTISSIRQSREQQSDSAFILTSLGKLWLSGVKVDWSGFYAHQRRRQIPLPTYPFERQRYWIDAPGPTTSVPLRPAIENWFYVPTWIRSAPPPGDERQIVPSKCLVFLDETGLGAAIAAELTKRGAQVTLVTKGTRFGRLNDDLYSLNPQHQDEYELLARDLSERNRVPQAVLHLWTVTRVRDSSPELLDVMNDHGFYSLLFLAQSFSELSDRETVKIAVISNNLRDVTGDERIEPLKATLLGAATVVPQEYAQLTCISIDVVLAQAGTNEERRLIQQITAELSVDRNDPVVSYRGRHRWVQAFLPTPLKKPADKSITSRVRKGGVYLIAGGTGGVGLAIAESLASVEGVTLALVGRSGTSRAADKENHAGAPHGCADGIDLSEEADKFINLERTLYDRFQRNCLQPVDADEAALNDLCSGYIYAYFNRCGVAMEKGRRHRKRDIQEQLRILPKFERFFDFFIRTLEEDSIILVEGEDIVVLRDGAEMNRPAAIGPVAESINNLLAHCARHYDQALSGDIEAISVLYPNGELSELVRNLERQAEGRNTRSLLIDLLKEILLRTISKSLGKRIRILEVGAGNGELTWPLIESLHGFDITYTVTDIGKSFVLKAEKKAVELRIRSMDFRVFDISRDAVSQGFEESSFDVILALDVVHATPRIASTVRNLQRLLAANGLLCLLETVKRRRFTDMVFGLAEGWWYFDDHDLRTNSPLMTIPTWLEVFNGHDFARVEAFPHDVTLRDSAEFGLIVAQKFRVDNAAVAERRSSIETLKRLGAETMLLTADVSSASDMRAALAEVRSRFGRIDGVVHAAGVPGGGTIHRKTRAAVEAEFSAKVRGTLILDSLLRDEKLDFFVLCSSYTSYTGGFGQVAYSAANAFQDAFAYYKSQKDPQSFTVSIDWDRWRNVGMAVSVEALHAGITQQELAGGMERAEGIDAFSRILSFNSSPCVIVSTRDFPALLQQSRASVDQVSEIQVPAPSRRHVRPQLLNEYTPPGTELERSIATIWQEELGIETIGLNDDFSELGGDSLLAIRLISRIRQTLDVQLSFRILYERSTVAGLAEHVETVRWAAQQTASSHAPIAGKDDERGSF